MELKHSGRIVLTSLALGCLADFLFWKQLPGVTVLVFIALIIAALFWLTRSEGLKPSKISYLLLIPILFFAVFIGLRLEPFTVFICWLLMLVCMAILAVTWLGGNWLKFSLADYIAQAFVLLGNGIVLPFEKLLTSKKHLDAEGHPEPSTQRSLWWKKIGLPIFVGLVIAVPAVAILGSLLASADPIFKDQAADLFKYIAIPNLGEFISRTLIILVLAFSLSGAYLTALLKSRQEKLIGTEKPFLPQFLNWITSTVVILCVDVLFAFFVFVQFRYFFGGQANITSGGYTFAEYARSGFNEMLAVAILSLLLFLGLSTLTHRGEGAGRRIYSILGITLVLLVGVILVSAFQRLNLYESAYGFSRIRTQSHVFMIWLGILLAATVALEIANRLRAFALAALLVALGFGASLTILNQDAFIARQNLARAAHGEKLDIPYLVSLSEDAVPEIYQVYRQSKPGDNIHDEVSGVLACRYREIVRKPNLQSFQSFHWSHYFAGTIFDRINGELPVSDTNIWGSAPIFVNGKTIDCDSQSASSNED
jgi:hypothetical protein